MADVFAIPVCFNHCSYAACPAKTYIRSEARVGFSLIPQGPSLT